MESTLNLNHNAAECIKGMSSIGETVYYNICTGTTSTVPWGGLDWLALGLGLAFVIPIILMILCLLFIMLIEGF